MGIKNPRYFALETKLEVIRRYAAGEKPGELAKAYAIRDTLLLPMGLRLSRARRSRSAARPRPAQPGGDCGETGRPGPAAGGAGARRLGGGPTTHRAAGEEGRPAGPGIGFFQARLAALRHVAPAERERWSDSAYATIQARARRQGGLSVERMCALAGVSRTGYYRHWQASRPRQEETALRDRIQQLALAHRHYGYRRLTALLKREGVPVNHKRVLRIARADNLLCLRKRRFVPMTTQSNHRFKIWPNLARWLTPTALDQLWVADITYIRLDEAFAYLAVVIDAFSRRVIGWELADHLRAELALAALRMALAARTVTPDSRLIHHSDRGVQYACTAYIATLEHHGIQPSMSRAGCPYDNAMAESFMKTLKHEEVDASDYRNQEHARQAISAFLETVYNRQRLHSALDYKSPAEYEAVFKIAKPGWAAVQQPSLVQQELTP